MEEYGPFRVVTINSSIKNETFLLEDNDDFCANYDLLESHCELLSKLTNIQTIMDNRTCSLTTISKLVNRVIGWSKLHCENNKLNYNKELEIIHKKRKLDRLKDKVEILEKELAQINFPLFETK